MMKDFSELLGQQVGFCGVDNNSFCVVAPGGERIAFEVVEDENDGYRSSLEEVKPVPLDGLVFFGAPVATLTVQEEPSLDGYKLVDVYGHAWLRFGTDDFEDYYPCFTFDYDPPKGSPAQGRGGPESP
jgi:hypothetical protein